LNLDFYIKKKHIFKNRKKTSFIFSRHKKTFIQFLYTTRNCRIDLVSIRLFKKLLRRKFIKAKTRFFKPKYWILMMPNFLLTQKSKNSRMGAGVGKFVRLTSIISSGKSFIKTWYYTYVYLRYIVKYMHYKIPQKFLIKIVTNKKKIENRQNLL
jgi:ribosomal protein L16/L10AE